MIRKLLLAVVGVTLIVGGIIYTKLGQFDAMIEAGASMVMPAETVTAAEARVERWEQSLTATGTLAPVQGVTIGVEAPGRVARIEFESGKRVEAGDLLVQLDAATENAQLAAAEATAALARANLARAREMRERKMVSPADIDTADALAKEAAAEVQSVRAALARKTIRAPFTGRLGLRQVNLGQILRDGDPVVSLQALDPIHVDFSMPQQHLPLLGTDLPVRLTTDAAPGEIFMGAITAVSPEIDPVTRNVRVQALVPNPDEKLRGGMFVNVEVVLPQAREVLSIPATSVLYAPYGDSVFVVEEHGNDASGEIERVLRQQFVRLGSARGDFVAVVDGLKAGETVVSSGVFKLRSGMAVVIDNTLAPEARLDPKPGDS